jgi:hypothetical protein
MMAIDGLSTMRPAAQQPVPVGSDMRCAPLPPAVADDVCLVLKAFKASRGIEDI